MHGRLGGMYFLHLAEAVAQRRRLAEAHPEKAGADRQATGPGLFVLLRLLGVMGVGFAAIATLAVIAG